MTSFSMTALTIHRYSLSAFPFPLADHPYSGLVRLNISTADNQPDQLVIKWSQQFTHRLEPAAQCAFGKTGRISSSNNGNRRMNRPHSHRNLLWSGHWPVVFHKQTGTHLYPLFVSWLFYWQSNGRVDGLTMCILSDAYFASTFSLSIVF